MNIQDEIAVHIHSIDYALRCHVCSHSERTLIVSPNSGKTDMFQVNDPVVCIYMEDGQVQLTGGDVKAVDSRNREVTIVVPLPNKYEEKRLFERYPTSLAVSARRKYSSKRIHFLAKNISLYGIGVFSTADLDLEEAIDIDVLDGKYAFYFGGKVVWKIEIDGGFEYGFQLSEIDVVTKNNYETYLQNIKNEYRNMYTRAR